MDKDENALQALMERYGNELTRTAYLLTKDRQTAEEAVMDAFIQAYRSIRQLKDPDKLRSWLLRIVVNRCRMKMRTWSWRRIFPSAEVERMIEDTEADPEELFLADWRNAKLNDAIRRLDYKYREAITLYYFNEWSVAEIAEQTSENTNTIKARLARGREKLRKMWEEEGDGDATRDQWGADGEKGARVY